MAPFPELHRWTVGGGQLKAHVMPKGNPRADGDFDTGRSSMRLLEGKRPNHKICAYWRGTVNSHKGCGRKPAAAPPRFLHPLGDFKDKPAQGQRS